MKGKAYLRAAAGFLGLAIATAELRAQEPSVPEGPLLKSAPEFSQWTVSFFSNGGKAPAPAGSSGADLRQMTVTKTRNVIREEFKDSKGGVTEVWHVDATQYRKPAGQSVWFESGPSDNQYGLSDPNYVPLPANGFRGWDWMSNETYAGRIVKEAGECLVFVPTGTPTPDLSDPKKLEKETVCPRVALVNDATRLPMLLRSGNQVQKFEFGPAPTAMQELPADLIQQIKAGREAKERLAKPVPRPY